jgi:hypothetical protein
LKLFGGKIKKKIPGCNSAKKMILSKKKLQPLREDYCTSQP